MRCSDSCGISRPRTSRDGCSTCLRFAATREDAPSPQDHATTSERTMNDQTLPVAIVAADAAPRSKQTNYPQPFASRMAGREKRPLGDVFGLTNFGVNLTRL